MGLGFMELMLKWEDKPSHSHSSTCKNVDNDRGHQGQAHGTMREHAGACDPRRPAEDGTGCVICMAQSTMRM